jgi:hypothetical protein
VHTRFEMCVVCGVWCVVCGVCRVAKVNRDLSDLSIKPGNFRLVPVMGQVAAQNSNSNTLPCEPYGVYPEVGSGVLIKGGVRSPQRYGQR